MWFRLKGGETSLDVTCMCYDHQHKDQRMWMWFQANGGRHTVYVKNGDIWGNLEFSVDQNI